MSSREETVAVGKLTRWVAIVLMASLVSGCMPVYFHNGGTATGMDDERLHSTVIFGAVEWSDPQDLGDLCRGSDWETAKTELTILGAVLASFTFGLYTPWGFGYRCTR